MAKNLTDILVGVSSGVLKVTNGGTGVGTITGIVKGNGTSAVTAATVGTDYSVGTSALATGILYSTTATGALSIATAGTHYVAPGGALGTPTSGTLSSCTVDGTVGVGYITVPQNQPLSFPYTTVLSDSGKHIFHSNATAHTFTIPANSSVAYPIGTVLTFINDTGSGALSITFTDTVVWIPLGSTTATRTLSANGMATAIKVASTKWFLSGSGLS